MGERSWACFSGLELTGDHDVVTRVVRQLKEGEFVVLKWARQDGCLWDKYTCSQAAAAGRLDMPRWAREILCPWGGNKWRQNSQGGSFRSAEMGVGQRLLLGKRLALGRWHVHLCSRGRASGYTAVGARTILPLDIRDLRGDWAVHACGVLDSG